MQDIPNAGLVVRRARQVAALAVILASVAPVASHAQASAGDAARGATLFKQRCQTCHAIEPGGRNGIGPALFGVYGRKAGVTTGYAYSAALKNASIVWNDPTLDAWLVKPAAVAKGTKMFMAPISKPQDRKDLIAYLRKQRPSR